MAEEINSQVWLGSLLRKSLSWEEGNICKRKALEFKKAEYTTPLPTHLIKAVPQPSLKVRLWETREASKLLVRGLSGLGHPTRTRVHPVWVSVHLHPLGRHQVLCPSLCRSSTVTAKTQDFWCQCLLCKIVYSRNAYDKNTTEIKKYESWLHRDIENIVVSFHNSKHRHTLSETSTWFTF